MLRDRRLACKVGLLQVVMKVQVANEGRYSGALFQVVEAEEVRRECCVSHVQADADRRVVYRRDLVGQLRGPDGVVVDRAVKYGQLGIVVLDGDGYAELPGQIPHLS